MLHVYEPHSSPVTAQCESWSYCERVKCIIRLRQKSVLNPISIKWQTGLSSRWAGLKQIFQSCLAHRDYVYMHRPSYVTHMREDEEEPNRPV